MDINNMAYSVDDFCDTFSENSNETASDEDENSDIIDFNETNNVTLHILNRQIYGRFARNSRAKTERPFKKIHPQCRMSLSSLVKHPENMQHIFMGFTLCSTYFLSFTERGSSLESGSLFNMLESSYEYELHLWRFRPGKELKYLTKYRIFKQLQGSSVVVDNVLFMQFPRDPHRVICYGIGASNTPVAYMSILTLPSKACRHCDKSGLFRNNDVISEGWCTKHGFILHYTFPLSNPKPEFVPRFSLAYPDYIVVNTGHYIHILNITTANPPQNVCMNLKEDYKIGISFNDSQSEASEPISDHYETNSVVDGILEDFNEYDMEAGESNKPFHELNISCEPLNVTGKSYHNALVQNIVDPRMKRLQTTREYHFSVPHPSSSATAAATTAPAVSKIDPEKAYEFIDETEKCEKLSSFRKRRLAEKKYEFSEDNTENIVPFNSLRRERRIFRRCIRSPEFGGLFLSPRSPGIRSPVQHGQFSPGAGRHVYCPSGTTMTTTAARYRASPISPKDARKFHGGYEIDYEHESPRLLIMRERSGVVNSNGLLIVDPVIGREQKPKWIKKVVRRYSNGDFENGSLLSGQSRDDFNMPIEIPLIAQTLSDQLLDVVPDCRADQITQMQLIITQRTFDCDQFVQRRAQQLCIESQLDFLHCQDYDIKIIYVCPLEGLIICKAHITIGALKNGSKCKPAKYCSEFIFTWNIETDAFKVIISPSEKLCLLKDFKPIPHLTLPKLCRQEVLVQNYSFMRTKAVLRDYSRNYEIFLEHSSHFASLHANVATTSEDFYFSSDISSDSSNGEESSL